MDLAAIGQSIAVGRVIAEFSDVMDHLREVTEKEATETDEFLTQQCEADLKAVTAAYASLRAACTARYSALLSALTTAKQEAKTFSSTDDKKYSPATVALIQTSGHLLGKEANIVPVRAMVETGVKVSVGEVGAGAGVEEDVKAWGLGLCVCERCKKMWQGLFTTKQSFDVERKITEEIAGNEAKAAEERKKKETEDREKAEKIATEAAKATEFRQLQESQSTLKSTADSLQSRLALESAQCAELRSANERLTQELKQLKDAIEARPPWCGPPGGPDGPGGPGGPGGPWGGPGGPWGGPGGPWGWGHHGGRKGRHHDHHHDRHGCD